MDIDGAVNNDLGSSDQQVCMICLDLTQEAMEELDIVITAPNGSSVALTVSGVIGFGTNIFFEICFVSCDQSAAPDAGFDAVFNASNDWQDNTTYTGTYYPQAGCLEDLSGPVNGEWQLDITDVVFLEDGELFDWYMVFGDGTGIGCENEGECGVVNSCIAEGGELDVDDLSLCEGDPDLDINADPSFPAGNEPPASEYDYTYIISDANTGVILDITPSTDLTSFAPGTYEICGLSYLIDDAGNIPSADGSLTINDIQDDIDDDVYCADISDECFEVVILSNPPFPDFQGPPTVCIGDLVQFEVLNYDSDYTYLFSIVGSFSTFIVTDGVVEFSLLSGPAEICVSIEDSCTDTEVCLTIDIAGALDPFEILGNLNPCPGSIETYDFLPIPDSGDSYEVTLTAGTILSQTDTSVEIEWPSTDGVEELCIELMDPACDADPFCVDIDIEFGFELTTDLNTPNELCLESVSTSFIPSDTDILNYTWTLTNLDLISGQGTEVIEYEGIALGFAEVCLEIETICGIQGPVCEAIEILETPEPEITDFDPSCLLVIDLESTADAANNIEWTLLSGPGSVGFDPADEANTTATFSDPGTYALLLTETNGICQAMEEIEITILDDLEIIDLSLDCNLNNEYLVSFEIVTGVEPYSVNGNALVGSIFESDPINSGEDYFFEILDDLGCSTILEGNFDCPCLSDAGSMPLDLIESCILDDDIVIVEWNIDGVLDNNDLGTYILHDNQFDELGQIIAINEFGEFEYSTDMIPGQTYYISYVVGDELSGMVDLDDLCLSVSFGQPIVFYNPTILDFEVASETCEMSILIDGVIPVDISDILWNQIAGPGSSSFNTNSSLPTTITVSEQGVYTYEVEVLNSACTSYQVFEVNFLSPPQIINPVEECTGSSDFYTISVEVQGGEAPYQSNIPGAFANNIFTSEPIPSGEPYSLIITDNFGCASIAFDGVKLCDCSSDAGVLNGTPITLCEGDILVFDPIENEVLDPNDFGQYYLYFNDQFGNQILLDSSTTPMFQFQNTFSLDVPYLISFFVANELNNTLDFTDPCLDISNSFTATWNAYPIVEAGDDQEICLDEVALSASPVGGQWNIISSPTGAVAELNNENDNNAILSLDTPGAYVLEWSSTNGQCEANDQVTVTRNIIPEVANLTTTCSADLETFQLDFDVSGGGPFMVNGELVIDAYTSDGLDNDIANVFFIENALGCSTTVLIDPVNCECQNDAGTVVNNSFSLCTDELLNPAISNGDYLLEQGDSLMYIIHNGTATEIGDILVSSFGEEIMFDDVFETNTSYFLTAVVGAFLNGTIDLNDPCIKFSESVPVEWLEDNDIIFVGMLEACIGDIVDAEIQVTGSLPVELTISNDQGLVEVISIQNASEIISFEVMDAFQEWTITDVVGDCIDEITSDLVVIGQEPLAFNLSQDLETCNGTSFVSTIDLSSIIDIDVSLGEWISTEIPIVDGVADFTTLDAGEYNLEFTTVGLEGLCAGSASSTVITVIECVCPIFINDEVMLCNNQDLFDLSILDTQGYEGTWSIENNASLNSPPVIQNTDLNPGGATGGLYALLYTITQTDYPEECDNLIVINLVIEEENKTGFQDEPAIYCQDDLLEINLFDLLEGEDAGGVWTYEGEAISEIQNTGDLVLGVNEFFYAFANEATLCPENQSSVIVDIKPVPIFQAVGENVSCFGEADGELLITVEDVQGSIEPVSCYVNDILQEEGKVLTDLSPGVYTIYVENEFCKSAIQEVTIEEPDPVIVSLGDDREILLDEVIVIEAITNILDSDVDSITWFDLAEILLVDEFELMATFDSDVIINVEIIDINDCVAFDQISISVLTVKESIYLPNIFNPESQMGNETFGIMNPEIVDVLNTFIIYDRWGNLVFSQDAITGIQDLPRWDGSYNGLPAEMGVYVYFVEVTLNSGETEIYAGDVTLMR